MASSSKKLGESYPSSILDVGTGIVAVPHLMGNCGRLMTTTDNIHDH
jgi:hypothetical protein